MAEEKDQIFAEETAENTSGQSGTYEMISKIRGIIEKTRICFLNTLSGKQLVSRPMYLQQTEFDGDLWFFTRADSEKIAEIKKDSRVSVSFAGKEFVSVSGRAEIVETDLKKQRMWNKAMEQFFETEASDPQIVLICVKVENAHYWENTGNLKGLIKRVTALDESRHESIQL